MKAYTPLIDGFHHDSDADGTATAVTDAAQPIPIYTGTACSSGHTLGSPLPTIDERRQQDTDSAMPGAPTGRGKAADCAFR